MEDDDFNKTLSQLKIKVSQFTKSGKSHSMPNVRNILKNINYKSLLMYGIIPVVIAIALYMCKPGFVLKEGEVEGEVEGKLPQNRLSIRKFLLTVAISSVILGFLLFMYRRKKSSRINA